MFQLVSVQFQFIREDSFREKEKTTEHEHASVLYMDTLVTISDSNVLEASFIVEFIL